MLAVLGVETPCSAHCHHMHNNWVHFDAVGVVALAYPPPSSKHSCRPWMRRARSEVRLLLRILVCTRIEQRARKWRLLLSDLRQVVCHVSSTTGTGPRGGGRKPHKGERGPWTVHRVHSRKPMCSSSGQQVDRIAFGKVRKARGTFAN